MADYVNTAPPSGQVLTYNTTNDRGWNDPPSYVFSPGTNTNRKRIDPRKRVGHDLTGSTGIVQSQQQQPTSYVQPQQPSTFLPPNHIQQEPSVPYTNLIQPIPSQTPLFANPQPAYVNGFIPQTIHNVSNTNNPPPLPNAHILAPPSNMVHATSNPDLHNMMNGVAIQQPIQHASSMPYNLESYKQPLVHHHPTTQLPPPLAVTLPPPAPLQTALPPNAPMQNLSLNCSHPPQATGKISPYRSPTPTGDKATQNGRKLDAPTTSINNTNPIFGSSIFSQLSTPTMLQSSHLANKGDTSSTTNASNTGFRAISPTTQLTGSSFQPLQNTHNQFSTLANPKLSIFNNPAPLSLPTMPVAMATEKVHPHHVRANSLTGIQQLPNMSLTNTPAAAPPPPMNGFYAANKIQSSSKHSPNSLSPHNSGTNSPVPTSDKLILENDSELLNETVDRLLDCRDKCACITTNKISEEINKKIQAFKLAWTTGKLSTNVKLQMSNLSIALDKREFAQADSIHKSLILSHSSEVMSWMVGVKKLISSYQKVVEENNKY